MAQQVIGIGASPGDGTGDALRVAFQKCNSNFTELYNSFTSQINAPAGFGYSINSLPIVKADTVSRNYYFGGGAGGNGTAPTATGDFNLGIGDSTLANLTGGGSNVAVGFAALFSNVSGNSNIAIGFEPMESHTSGDSNIAIGSPCMSASLTCAGNIAIGQQALNSLTANDGFAGGHIAIGNVSMQSYTDHSGTGLRNTAVGHSTMQALGKGGNNTACGFEALLFAGRNDHSVTVNNSTAFGSLAGCYDTDGSDSVFVGAFCGFGNSRADSPTFSSNAMTQVVGVGSKALFAIGNGQNIVAVGYQAGADLTDGANGNTLIGANTGRGITTGTNNTILGAGVTGLSATLSSAIVIADGGGNIRLDYGKTVGGTWTMFGPLNGMTISTNAGSGAGQNTFLGANTGSASNLTTGHGNTAVGWSAGGALTTGILNVCLGLVAGAALQDGSTNIAIGSSALQVATSCGSVIAIGGSCLANFTDGGPNVAIGFASLFELTTGNNNAAFGYNSGRGITTGSANTILGSNVTGLAATLSNSIILADGAGNIRLDYNKTIANLWAFSANVLVNNPTSASVTANCTTAGQQSLHVMQDAGVNMWAVLKNTDNSFNIFDYTNSVNCFSISLSTKQISFSYQALFSASTTTRASLRMIAGTAPTSPTNGDIWFDGTNFKAQVGGVTKTFTIT